MRPFRLAVLWTLILSSPVLAGPGGPRPEPINEALQCRQMDSAVVLEWNIQFLIPIDSFLIARDGEPLAKLPPEATSYLDQSVTPGPHVYHLSAIQLGPEGSENGAGQRIELGSCSIDVVETLGLRCRAEENTVRLEWGPILIDIPIVEFLISRNGETIATVPPDQLIYDDVVFSTGTYEYVVHARTSPDSEFFVGSCKVNVSCFGIQTEVSGLEVHLAWDGGHGPLGSPIAPIFTVTRDNEVIVKTDKTEITDTVPAPGKYLYRVIEDRDLILPPTRLVGECIVIVTGDSIPPPRGLRCTVLPLDLVPHPVEANSPGAIDTDGDGVPDGILPGLAVVLEWTNPIAYEKIVISRNNVVVATLAGSETRFVDHVRGGGIFEYAVRGLVGNVESEPARCVVEAPSPFVPPPQDFTCVLLDVILDPADPDHPGGGNITNDESIAPFPVVLLRWWNPVKYAKLFISRDGAELAQLSGDAMRHRDVSPPSGSHVYGIHGVLEDGRVSPTVFCEIDVGGTPVPPVTDLQCSVAEPAAGAVGGAVILVWKNAGAYDRIFILRDGAIVFEDTGALEKYIDRQVDPGQHQYCVLAEAGGKQSVPTCCQVVIGGPVQRNVLYFTPGPVDGEPGPVDLTKPLAVPEPLPPLPGNRITCLAANVSPLQGWSFGVSSDPKFIAPKSVDIEGTSTKALHGGAGPEFIHMEILDGGAGVVMAVVVGGDETLPPGQGHRLLNIEYETGPSGMAGEAYSVRYTDTLGSPPVQVLFVVDGFEVAPRTLPGWVSVPGPNFLRGDSNGDGRVDVSDGRFTLDYLFLGGREPDCLEASNANGSTRLNLADVIYTLQALFGGGPPPPAPFPLCGTGPTPLGCKAPGPCVEPAAAN